MRRRTQAEMDQLVAAAGFRKIEQRIDEWGIFTVSLAERIALVSRHRRRLPSRRPSRVRGGAPSAGSPFWRRSSIVTYGAANCLAAQRHDVALDRVRLGTPDPVPRLDDHSVLVDQRLLRPVAVRLRHAGPSSTPTAGACSPRRSWRSPASFCFRCEFTFRAAGDPRACRLSVRRADQLRQAVQPGAVAAHRAARHPLGLYASHVPRWAQWPLHPWFALVGASVLTTYQHHFFDIPTGALLGVFCLWLWPDRGESPLATAAFATDRRRLVLAARYLIGGGSASPRSPCGSAAPACGCYGPPSRCCSSRRTTRSSGRTDSRRTRTDA